MLTDSAHTTLGTSFALLEAEAAWFVSQGHSPETVALWIDEPLDFVLNAVGDLEAGTWYVWVREKWQRRVAKVGPSETIMTPKQIDARAAAVQELNMRRGVPRRVYSDRQILKALKQTDGKAREAATLLKCHPSTIYERLNAMKMRMSEPIDAHR